MSENEKCPKCDKSIMMCDCLCPNRDAPDFCVCGKTRTNVETIRGGWNFLHYYDCGDYWSQRDGSFGGESTYCLQTQIATLTAENTLLAGIIDSVWPILWDAPELCMCNFDVDEVGLLNTAVIEVCEILRPFRDAYVAKQDSPGETHEGGE